MGKEVLNYVVEKTHELIGAPTCNSETKAAAKAWLDAVETENRAAKTKKHIDELEADIIPIDGLTDFAKSDADSQAFGSDKAKDVVAHAKETKAARTKFCDCPACAAVEVILNEKEDLLK